MVSSKRNKVQRNGQVKLIATWQYTEEASLAFKRLMMILLQLPDDQPTEISQAEKEYQNEQ